MEYEVEGLRPRGRPKMTWIRVVEKDCQARTLNKEDAIDRSRWRKLMKDVWWSLIRMGVSEWTVPDQGPLNSCVCVSAAMQNLLNCRVGQWLALQHLTNHNWGSMTRQSVYASCHTLQARQLNFLGHLIWSENSTYALYQPPLDNTDEGDFTSTTSTTFTRWQDTRHLNCWSWQRKGMSGENFWFKVVWHTDDWLQWKYQCHNIRLCLRY